jgi:hypothetical protein
MEAPAKAPEGNADGGDPASSAASSSGRILNGGWQSDKDVTARRKMIAKIVALLQQRKPNAPEEWLLKLPQMAKRLEESLYRSAADFDSYNDVSTLKQRLQALAMSIGLKTQQQKKQQAAQAAAAAGGQPTVVNMQQVRMWGGGEKH